MPDAADAPCDVPPVPCAAAHARDPARDHGGGDAGVVHDPSGRIRPPPAPGPGGHQAALRPGRLAAPGPLLHEVEGGQQRAPAGGGAAGGREAHHGSGAGGAEGGRRRERPLLRHLVARGAPQRLQDRRGGEGRGARRRTEERWALGMRLVGALRFAAYHSFLSHGSSQPRTLRR